MKIAVDEKDDTQRYRPIPIEQFMEAVHDFEDRVEIYVPNLCGGETRITLFKTDCPLGNTDNLKLLKQIKIEGRRV